MKNNAIKYEQIFTEYDKTISIEINKDPLGQQLIWTHFGQKIFKNKTTSVALDIRSYNINLFHHYIIYKLREKDKNLSHLFSNRFSLKERVERVLLLLENIIIWSWWNNSDNPSWERNGLLGTSKASIWKNEIINIDLLSDIPKLQLLKNQKSLGVNGRYKRPFMEMKFFTSKYDYESDGCRGKELFDKFEKEILKKNKDLASLVESMIEWLLNREIYSMPQDFITKVFGKTNTLAKITKDFWLENLGLRESPAKEIYDILNIFVEDNQKVKYSVKTIYSSDVIKYDSKVKDIKAVEPRLTYLYWLFEYLLCCHDEDLEIIDKELFHYFNKYKNLEKINEENLFRLAEINNIVDAKGLIKYHQKLMEQRQKSFWIKINENMNDKIKIFNKSKKNKKTIIEKLDKEIEAIDWINDYYIRSIMNIKMGLEVA